MTLVLKTGIFLIALVVPLVYWNSTMYPFLTLKVALFQSLVELLAAVWLTLIIWHPRYRPRLTPLAAALCFLLTALLVSAWFGVDFQRSFWSVQPRLTGIFLIAHLTTLFFMLSSLTREEQWPALWRRLWWAGLMVSVIGTISGILGRYFGLFTVAALGYGRVGTLFGNPTFLAGYLLFNVFVGILLAIQEQRWWLRVGALLLSMVAAAGIFLTQTLGNLIGLLVGVTLTLTYVAVHYRSRLLTVLLVAQLTLVGTAVATRSNPIWQVIPGFSRLHEIRWEASNLQNRFIAWRAGWQAFQQRPWLGWGWENFNIAFNHYYDPALMTSTASETFWDKPHNIFLEYLYTAGIVGLAAFLGLLGAAFYEGWRRRSSPAIAVLLIGLIAYLIQGLAVFDTPGVYLMLFFYLAYIDGEYQREILNPRQRRGSPGAAKHEIRNNNQNPNDQNSKLKF